MVNGPQSNSEKTKYLFMSHQQHAKQRHDVNRSIIPYETEENFKYSVMTRAKENISHERIKNRIN
jgi:hypothetical protein